MKNVLSTKRCIYIYIYIYSQPISRELFYLVEIFRTSSLGGSISNNPERTEICSEEVHRKLGHIQVLQQKLGNQEHQRLLLMKENQISQIKEFYFSIWEDAQIWAH